MITVADIEECFRLLRECEAARKEIARIQDYATSCKTRTKYVNFNLRCDWGSEHFPNVPLRQMISILCVLREEAYMRFMNAHNELLRYGVTDNEIPVLEMFMLDNAE
jgi:hypothetical protein